MFFFEELNILQRRYFYCWVSIWPSPHPTWKKYKFCQSFFSICSIAFVHRESVFFINFGRFVLSVIFPQLWYSASRLSIYYLEIHPKGPFFIFQTISSFTTDSIFREKWNTVKFNRNQPSMSICIYDIYKKCIYSIYIITSYTLNSNFIYRCMYTYIQLC